MCMCVCVCVRVPVCVSARALGSVWELQEERKGTMHGDAMSLWTALAYDDAAGNKHEANQCNPCSLLEVQW